MFVPVRSLAALILFTVSELIGIKIYVYLEIKEDCFDFRKHSVRNAEYQLYLYLFFFLYQYSRKEIID